MPRRTSTTDTRPEPTANPAYGPGSEPTPSAPAAEYIADLLKQENPFGGNPVPYLNDLVRGQTGGDFNVRDERIPLYPHVPTGAEARALWEAAGVHDEHVRRGLGLSPGDFGAWTRGEKNLVSEILPQEIDTDGVRRVFGVLFMYLNAKGAAASAAPQAA